MNTSQYWFSTSGADLGDEINQSLRFDNNSTQFLRRDWSAQGDRQTWTFSTWLKLADFGSNSRVWTEGDDSGSTLFTSLMFQGADNKLRFYSYNGSDVTHNLVSTHEFRDQTAWYHIVVAMDTTQGTADDRIKIYVNGVRLESWDTKVDASPNYNTYVGYNGGHSNIGQYVNGSAGGVNNGFSGYMAETIFIEGSQLAPTSFGKTNNDGVWVPQDYTGSFSGHSWRLKYNNSDGLGNDSGGNNDFTAYNFGTGNNADKDIDYSDTPTNNFATLNNAVASDQTTDKGSLRFRCKTTSGVWNGSTSTLGVSSGKWYWEATCIGSSNFIGIIRDGANDNINAYPGQSSSPAVAKDSANGWGIYNVNGSLYHNSNPVSYGTTYTDGDVIGIAMDLDNNAFWVSKNGIWFNSATQSQIEAGTTTYAAATNLTGSNFRARFSASDSTSIGWDVNFGQRAFAYTKPTGFEALQSSKVATPTIKNGKDHFDILTYDGDGNQTRTLSGLNFAPDLVWIKHRNGASTHNLQDTVRGAGTNALRPDVPNVEGDGSSSYGYISAFTSDGFTVDRGTLAGGRVNSTSGQTYVAWAWKAGDTANVTYTVKVVNDSGNKYRFDDFGTSAVTLDLEEGGTYIFDQSDSSNSGHPLRFSTTSDGTHGSGSEYTTGVTTTGTPGSAGAKTTIVVAAGAPTLYYYCSVHSGMGGQANTNDTKGSSNFAGTIQSKVSANTDAGFSIVSYTGNATSGATIGHGLNSAPQFMIVRNRDDVEAFAVYHHELDNTAPEDYWLRLDNDASKTNSAAHWNDTAPNNSVFTVGNANATNGSAGHNDKMIAYCWHEVEGFSKFGVYTANGLTNGPFVYTGFRPAFVLIKRSDSASHSWTLLDTARDDSNPNNLTLVPSADSIEDSTYDRIDIFANGFKNVSNWAANNTGTSPYVYIAFAENPFAGENTPPATAR